MCVIKPKWCIFQVNIYSPLPLSQEWWNLGPDGTVRTWPKDHLPPNPFKRGEKAALREMLPSGDNPCKIKIDIAHTYAICGYGKDDLASTLVFLAVRCNLWGDFGMEKQLDLAYGDFVTYCETRKKTTSILDFSKQELKILSFFDLIHCTHFCCFTGFIIFLIPCRFALYIATCLLLRLKDFPKGLGKGFDAALMGAWLEDVVGRTEEDMIPVSRFQSHQPCLLFKCIPKLLAYYSNASQT